jgi:hypothetical protein
MDIQLSADEFASLANASLDHYIRGKPTAQTLQEKPTLAKFRSMQKEFPGGKQLIRGNVKGDYTTAFMGYSYDDAVTYSNPANIKQFSYEWFELHGGIGITHTELKQNGISVVDSLSGENIRQLSEDDHLVISKLFEDKLDDMDEGLERSFQTILWGDGTQSSKVFPGITALIRGTPTSGIIGGIDSGANSWWRNLARTGASKILPSTSASTLTKTLRSDRRQLLRYGGKPSHVACGSAFIEALEAEVHAKGFYTQTGFAKDDVDVGIGTISIRGIGTFNYEPYLDEVGLTNFAYAFDMRHIKLMPMRGENMKKHAPARPENRYVLYRAVTWTGALVAHKLNGCAVWEINPAYT